MENHEGQSVKEMLKGCGYEVDFDWGEENKAALSKTVNSKVITVLIEVASEL